MGNEYDRIIWGTGLLLRTAEDDERHHCLWTITTHPAATHHHKQSNVRSLPSSVTITRERWRWRAAEIWSVVAVAEVHWQQCGWRLLCTACTHWLPGHWTQPRPAPCPGHYNDTIIRVTLHSTPHMVTRQDEVRTLHSMKIKEPLSVFLLFAPPPPLLSFGMRNLCLARMLCHNMDFGNVVDDGQFQFSQHFP